MNFFYRYKKLLLILGFITVTIFIGYLIFIFFFKPSVPLISPGSGTSSTTTSSGGQLPTAGQGGSIIPGVEEGDVQTPSGLSGIQANDIARGGLTQTSEITKTPTLGASLNSDGNHLNYYNKDNGKFFKIDKNGEEVELSKKVFHNVEKVTWSNIEDKAIIEYPDGANIIYDFNSEKQITLPKHWEDFNFSPVTNQIVMKSIGLDVNNRWLAITNDDGSKVTAIEQIGKNADTVYPSWSPNNQSIAMYTKGVSFDEQEVFFLGLNDENFKSTIIKGRDFRPLWSKDGTHLLYSVYSSENNLKPSLWTVRAQGDSIGSNRKSLGLETWANKCAFMNNAEVYCAVPEYLEEGAGLFPELALNSKDRLYKIDLTSGLKKLVAIPNGTFNMTNLIISDDNNYLYFVDNKTEKINKIRLK